MRTQHTYLRWVGRFLFLGACLILLSTAAAATAKSWQGIVSTAWNDPANWSPTGIPGINDDVTVNNGTTYALVISAAATAHNMSLNNGAVVSVDSGVTLTITNNLTIKNGATFNLGAGVLDVAGELKIQGTYNAGSGTITMGSSFNLDGGTFDAGTSTVVMTDSNQVIQGDPVTFYNLVLQSDTQAQTDITVEGDLTIDPGTTLDMNGYTLTVKGDILGGGTVTATAPYMVSVGVVSTSQLDVHFSEPVDLTTSQTASNYGLDNGIAVLSATRDGSDTSVVHLAVDPLADATTYTLTVNNVENSGGTPIGANSEKYFTTDFLVDFTITATASAGGSISPTGAVTVTEGNDTSFTVSANTGYHIDSVVVDGINEGMITNRNFTNVTANHTIDAYFSVDVLTITASAGAGGSITPPGAVGVNYGSDQGFTITPDPGYLIADVHADTTSLGAVSSYTFTNVTENHTITASFVIQTFPVTASSGPNGSVTPAGVTMVDYDGSQAYTITPDTGYFVADVFVDSVSVGAMPSYTFNNVTAPHTIHAVFSIQTFSITAAAGANGSVTPAGVTTVNYGGSQAYAITPNTGYFISDVFVDSVSVGAVPSYTFNNVTDDHTISAAFSITQYTITATASSGGSISPAGAVGASYGEDRGFTMTPDTGYHIDSVVVDGVNAGTGGTYNFVNITANHTIAAHFSINRYTITATASSGGSISPSGAVGVSYGDNQGFTISPDAGYYIADVHVDSVSVGGVSSFAFNNILTDHSIHATFAVQTFTITAMAGPNGSVSPSGPTVVNYGDTLTVTVTPDSGFFVADVTVDSVSVGAVGSYTFLYVTADHLLEASFGTNSAPTAPTLASPADGDTIPSGMLGSMDFSWHPSTDADAGDTLRYTLSINGPGVNYTTGGLTDTTVNLDLSAVLANGETYRWTVEVTDGQASVASADTFSFLVNTGTAVEEGQGLPTVYALGQNYPNPFNPATTIPFDLPERSTVTLTVYNILGAEVLKIAGGETMAAGSYNRTVDFGKLSSGAYFYRITAVGESGRTFGKVMRMVVMK